MRKLGYFKLLKIVWPFSAWIMAIFVLFGCNPSRPVATPTPSSIAIHTIDLRPSATLEITPTLLPITTTIPLPLTSTALSTETPPPTNNAPLIIPTPPTLSVTEEITFELLNQKGGQTKSIAIVDNIAYLGMGARLIVLDISDPSLPRPLGQSQVLPGLVHAILVRNQVVYVAAGAFVITLDISNPQSPTPLGELQLPGPVTHLTLDEDIVVAGLSFPPSESYENGLGMIITVDVGQLDQLEWLDSVTLPWYVNAIALANKTVYVSNPADDTFYAVYIITPANLPDPVAFPGIPLTYSLQAQNQTLFIAGGRSDLSAWDISRLHEPQKLWEIRAEPDTNFGLGVVTGLILADHYAYLGVVGYQGTMIGVLALQLPELTENTPVGLVSSSLVARTNNVFFVDDGLTIHDVSDPLNVLQIGSYTQPSVWDVALTGTIGVFVEGNWQQISNGNRLYSVSLPTLSILGQYIDEIQCQQCNDSFVGLTLKNNTAYVSASDNGLRIISLADPNTPNLLVSLDSTNGFRDFLLGSTAVNGAIYAADTGHCDSHNLRILDLSNPNSPQPITDIDVEGCIRQLSFDNGILYIAVTYADREGGAVHLLDVFNAEPQHLSTLMFPKTIYDVQVVDGTAIVGTSLGITTISTVDPTNPQILGELLIADGIFEVTITDGIALATTANEGSNGLLVAIDLRNPSVPRLVGIFHLPTGKGEIAWSDEYVLIGSPTMGLIVLQMSK